MLKQVFLCGFVSFVLGRENGGKPPNIVVIMADDMGWNDVGYHGSNEIPTPNIDALAYNGIMLERYYTGPTCTPSRTAYFTGKYPMRLGMQGPPLGVGQPRGLPLSETLLPQYLRNLGYATHLVGKWHVGYHKTEYTPTYRGFDSFFGYWSGYIGYFDGVHVPKMPIDGHSPGIDAHRNTTDAWQDFVGNYATDMFTKEATKVIYNHNTDKPLFLQVMHLAVHSGNGAKSLEVRNEEDTLTKYQYIKDYNRRLYAGMLEALDESVGQIISSLKLKGLLENTIVVFMSDNGAPTIDPIWNTNNYGSNWPLRGLKVSLHEGGVHVPAIIYSPLLSSNISTELFHVTDWLPTFYQAAGGNVANLGPIDGVTQWDALRTLKSNQRKYLLLDIDESFQQEALIHEHWKIIRYGGTRANFTNVYYGSTGRNIDLPEYNLTSVTSSAAHFAITEGREPINLNSYKQKRRIANIDSKCRLVEENTYPVKLCHDYCLFNIYHDPCETTDLSEERPKILQELISILEIFNKSKINRNNFTVDFRAHPKFWNDRWAPWLDTVTNLREPNISKSVLYSDKYIIFVLILSIFINRLCV